MIKFEKELNENTIKALREVQHKTFLAMLGLIETGTILYPDHGVAAYLRSMQMIRKSRKW